MADIHFAGSVVDVRGQAVLVSANVEDRELADRVGVWIGLARRRAASLRPCERPRTREGPCGS